MKYAIAQLIPILFFYMFFAYPDEILNISITPLGRFIAICLIVYYTNIHIMYGLFVCIFVVFYYQMDLVEGMCDISYPSLLKPFQIPPYISLSSTVNQQKYKEKNDEWDIFDWISPAPGEEEGFTNHNETSEDEFRKTNCINGQLHKNNQVINDEEVGLYFPQLSFKNRQCNPCNPQCKISITQTKINVQEELTYPKLSDNWVMDVWKTWFNDDINTCIPQDTSKLPYKSLYENIL
jgi:hypothetical protein